MARARRISDLFLLGGPRFFVSPGYDAGPPPRRPARRVLAWLASAIRSLLHVLVVLVAVVAAVVVAGLVAAGGLTLWLAPATHFGWLWAVALTLPAMALGMVAWDAAAFVYTAISGGLGRLLR